jgi:SulP family sulfate permease
MTAAGSDGSVGFVERHLPGLALLRGYQPAWLRPDLIAGATVFAVVVPQGLAYGELAGVIPVAGLYGAIAAMLAYMVFGGSRQLSVGPESGAAIIVAVSLAPFAAGADPARYAALAALLAVMVGAILVVGGIAKIGFMADFLSQPVLAGYIIGAALIVIGSQLGKLTGLSIESDNFFEQVAEVLTHLGDASVLTVGLSVALTVLLLVLKRFVPMVPGALVVVVIATAASVAFGLEARGVAVIGDIAAGLPAPSIPSIQLGDIASLLAPAFSLGLIVFADGILTARVFAEKHGYELDANQELIGLGTSNVAAGFLQAFPVAASQSRTVVVDSAGGRTQLVGLVATVLVVVFLLFLTPLLEPMPLAALGAIIVVAALGLVDVEPLRGLYRTQRVEFGLAIATLLSVLAIGILQGILIAVVLSLVYVISRISRPHTAVLGTAEGVDGFQEISRGAIEQGSSNQASEGIVVYRFDGPLFFANASFFQGEVRELVAGADPPLAYVLIDAEAIGDIDVTAAAMFEDLRTELAASGVGLGLARIDQRVRDLLARTGFLERLGTDEVFPTVRGGVEAFRARPARSAQPGERA